MAESRQWYIRTGDGAEYGPTDMDSLVACARDGRIDATCLLSADQTEWIPAASFPELEIQWICETQDGQFAGPFHKDCVTELIKQGAFPATVRLYRPDDPKREAERIELSEKLAKSQSETVAERTKGEQLAAELGKSRQLVHALSLELKNSKAETVGEQARGRRLAADLQTAQKQAIGLTSRLDAASREMSAVRKKNDDLQTRLEDAEQKIKELQKPKKPKNPLMALFGKDSAADLSALEQAARRELSAMKRPRGAHPRPFKNSQSDIIDV